MTGIGFVRSPSHVRFIRCYRAKRLDRSGGGMTVFNVHHEAHGPFV